MFWEKLVSDHLLVEMYKAAIVNQLESELTPVLYEEIEKRKLNIDFEPQN